MSTPYRAGPPGPLALAFLRRARRALAPPVWRRVVWHQQPWMFLTFLALPSAGALIAASVLPTHRAVECELGDRVVPAAPYQTHAQPAVYARRCELVELHLAVFERRSPAERIGAHAGDAETGPTLSVFDGVGTTFIARDDPQRDLDAVDAWALEASAKLAAGGEPATFRMALPGLPWLVVGFLGAAALLAWMSRAGLSRVTLEADLAEGVLVVKVRQCGLLRLAQSSATTFSLATVRASVEPIDNTEGAQLLRVRSDERLMLIRGDESALRRLAQLIAEISERAREPVRRVSSSQG